MAAPRPAAAARVAALLLALLSAAAVSGCTACSGDEQRPASPGGTGGGGAASSSTSSTAASSGSGGQGGATCPDVSLPPGVPDGWVRMPSAPCACDVRMAPDAAHASPVSWAPCGEGCSELVVDWSDEKGYRLLADIGAAGGGQPLPHLHALPECGRPVRASARTAARRLGHV